jgi:SAM-dependent methyltransferase
VLEEARQPGLRRVLDVGCAFGWSLDAARLAGFETGGVEVSAHAARSAAERHDVRSSTALFDAGSFDLVTMIDVIEHVRDPLALLREVRRVLRPGGRLAITTPDLSSLSGRLMGARWPYLIAEHVVYFDRSTIRQALHATGFAPRRIGPLRKSLRADYVGSILKARGDVLGRSGAAVIRWLGGFDVGFFCGDLLAIAAG